MAFTIRDILQKLELNKPREYLVPIPRSVEKLFGTKAEKKSIRKRWSNAIGGAVGGAASGMVTGGPIGAIVGAAGGGVYGYQDKRAGTGRRIGQKALAGLGIGYGAGSGVNLLTGAGRGATLGIGKAASKAASGKVLPATKADLIRSYVSRIPTGGQNTANNNQEMIYRERLAILKRQRLMQELERQRLMQELKRREQLRRTGGSNAIL